MKPRRDTKATKAAPKGKLDALPATISTRVLEQLVGIGEKRLRQLATANKLPPAKDGRWQTIPSIRGVVAHYREAGSPDALDKARLLKLQAETRLIDQTHQEREGELVNFNEALQVLSRGNSAVVSTIMGMTDLDIDKREAIILKIRETMVMFSAQMGVENAAIEANENKN
jgi:hypothetical protein